MRETKIFEVKVSKTQIATWALRAYMVYSITADLVLLGGIIYLIFGG